MTLERRPFNAKEASYLLTPNEFTNFTLALTINLESSNVSFPAFLPILKDSLVNVAAVYPTLRSRVTSLPDTSSKPGQERFKLHFEDAGLPIPIRVDEDTDRSLNLMLELELSRPIPIDVGPLMRVAVLKPSQADPGTVQLAFTFSHVAMDGRGGMEVIKDWAKLMRSRMLLSHVNDMFKPNTVSFRPQTLSDGIVKDMVPEATRKSWLSMFAFVSHIAGTFFWIWLKKPRVVKPLSPVTSESSRPIPGTRVLRMALTASQTSAVVTRAKHLGASVTGLLLSSAAVAIAPLTDSKSPQHTREGTGWSLLSWLGGIFPTASSIHHSTSSEPTSTTQLIRTPPQNYVPLLSGLAVDARPALGIAPHIGGSFNTVMLAAIPSTLVVPLGSTPADIFKASDKNAPLLTNTLRQATTPRIGYAWRYGMLLSDDKSHPDPGALKAMSFPNEPGSENPNATDGDSVVDEHPPFMAFTMSNLGRMGMEDAEGKDAWVKEVWLTSTARAMSSSGQVQWSNVTVGGVMRFIFSWVDGSLDENMIKEIATRLGLALCGEAVEIA